MFGISFRNPGWGDIVIASFLGIVLVVTISFAHAAEMTVMARGMGVGGAAAIALRAHGVDPVSHGGRGIVLFLVTCLAFEVLRAIIAAAMAG